MQLLQIPVSTLHQDSSLSSANFVGYHQVLSKINNDLSFAKIWEFLKNMHNTEEWLTRGKIQKKIFQQKL